MPGRAATRAPTVAKKPRPSAADVLSEAYAPGEAGQGTALQSKLKRAMTASAFAQGVLEVQANAADNAEAAANDATTSSTVGSPKGKKGKGKKVSPESAADAPRPRGFFRYQREFAYWYNYSLVQYFIAFLIVLNFLTNMAEKQIDPTSLAFTTFFISSEDFFNIIFAVELAWNAYAHWFRAFICSGWNQFDCIVVAVGMLSLFRIQGLPPPFKLLRILRAFRVFRLFKRIESLRKILSAIISAVPGVANAFVVVVLVISIYAILAVEFFHKFDRHPEPDAGGVIQIPVPAIYDEDGFLLTENVTECYYYNYNRPRGPGGELEKVYSRTPRGLCFSEEYYGNFFRAWYTLFQVLTGESWSEVAARPILFGWDYFADAASTCCDEISTADGVETVCKGCEGEYATNGLSNVIAGIFFLSFVIINGFVLINVVVAVLLNEMVSQEDDDDDDAEDDAPPPMPPTPGGGALADGEGAAAAGGGSTPIERLPPIADAPTFAPAASPAVLLDALGEMSTVQRDLVKEQKSLSSQLETMASLLQQIHSKLHAS